MTEVKLKQSADNLHNIISCISSCNDELLCSEIAKLSVAHHKLESIIMKNPEDFSITITAFLNRLDYLLIFKPTTQAVDFYFLGAWEKEKAGFKSKEEFLSYLNQKLKVLNKTNKL